MGAWRSNVIPAYLPEENQFVAGASALKFTVACVTAAYHTCSLLLVVCSYVMYTLAAHTRAMNIISGCHLQHHYTSHIRCSIL